MACPVKACEMAFKIEKAIVGYAYYVVDGVGLVVVRYGHTEKA